ncbi:unnamed protein product [Microthlaspi erraticum]|uniref:RNase H type-1 domain-containing protein n=1 Tax=Microthlaspi erraticum TaxID=1685480 RepID=A0A6D2HLI0_9BRAS|nr:unnamed protein product [Microthlaspi erraticum]
MARVERLIRWTYPDQGWVKLNTDDTSRGNPGITAAGGVIRNARGRGAHRVEVEVDSEMAVGFLKTGISEVYPLSFLMRLCHGFISRD